MLRQLVAAGRSETFADTLATSTLTQEVLAGIDELVTDSVRLQFRESVSCRQFSSLVGEVAQLANLLRRTTILLIVSATIADGETHGVREHTESLSGLGASSHILGKILTVVEPSADSLFDGCHFYL